ncbi:hypothetical protein EJC51_27225 [Streptomyces aquilus]|uniref:Uncharacterized protein n=1 Tax=Streptomyces aquilus TaxID=2548456 RepID=A0A3S9I4Z6_9ACTN|nr:hypothetical protein EJC51_27225 [Streptomyces aquilus]
MLRWPWGQLMQRSTGPDHSSVHVQMHEQMHVHAGCSRGYRCDVRGATSVPAHPPERASHAISSPRP